MATETPRDPSGAQSLAEPGRPIPFLVKDLQSPRRSAAIDELTAFASGRLSALAEYIEYTALEGERLVEGRGDKVAKALKRALFGQQAEIADEGQFYQRAAAAIRDWLIGRLEELLLTARALPAARSYTKAQAAGDKEQAKGRLDWWCDFHRDAGKLPPDLLAVHDLMYYARRPLAETAAILGKPIESVAKDRDEAVRLLRPLYDNARGMM